MCMNGLVTVDEHVFQENVALDAITYLYNQTIIGLMNTEFWESDFKEQVILANQQIALNGIEYEGFCKLNKVIESKLVPFARIMDHEFDDGTGYSKTSWLIYKYDFLHYMSENEDVVSKEVEQRFYKEVFSVFWILENADLQLYVELTSSKFLLVKLISELHMVVLNHFLVKTYHISKKYSDKYFDKKEIHELRRAS